MDDGLVSATSLTLIHSICLLVVSPTSWQVAGLTHQLISAVGLYPHCRQKCAAPKVGAHDLPSMHLESVSDKCIPPSRANDVHSTRYLVVILDSARRSSQAKQYTQTQ
jgi:hypothetical protein